MQGHCSGTIEEMPLEAHELKPAAKHIAFDMYHFRYYAGLYHRPSVHPFRQAVIYSLLLHFRVLLGFFYRSPTQDDDVWIGDFQALPEFAATFPEIVVRPETRELSKNLNKRLAHFTATRWRERQPDMGYYAGYFPGIEGMIASFTAALPSELRQVFLERTREFETRDSGTGGTAL
jgi:hypothetical protein